MIHSFEKLCLPHYQELIAFALKRTKNKAEAEDVVQAAVVCALRAWDRWEPQGDPVVQARAWMFRIVSGTFIKRYHHNKVFNRITDACAHEVHENLHQSETSEHPYFEVDTIGDEVHEALDRIKPEWSVIINLVYIEGVPASQVAKLLKIAPGTVRSRMARGRLALARILSPYAKQRFGYTPTGNETTAYSPETEFDGELLGCADEPELAVEPSQEFHPNSNAIDRIVAHNNAELLSV